GRFGLIGIVGLVGVFLGLREGGAGRAVAGIWLALAATAVAFFVTDRYRIHLIPAMALLVPAVGRRVVSDVAHRSWKDLGGLTVGLGVASAIVGWPLVATSAAKHQFDVSSTLADAHLARGRTIEA